MRDDEDSAENGDWPAAYGLSTFGCCDSVVAFDDLNVLGHLCRAKPALGALAASFDVFFGGDDRLVGRCEGGR